MNADHGRSIAIVGLGAILPDALDVPRFWGNILNKRYSITDVPPGRWRIDDYYDPDPNAPDKTYSKIGGWVQGFEFDWKGFHIPPKVVGSMDESQKWAVAITAQALEDYGYPARPLDLERTAVILGTAMGGEMHYLTHLRISFPELARHLQSVTEFSQLPADLQGQILSKWGLAVGATYPPVTEDSMPGEIPNIVSGRVANVFNLRGPNYITDAACASSFAAIDAAVEMLAERKVDAVLTGGVDHNMGASSFVKFCKIGALSATGTRPFGLGADGFVMGEGAAAFLLKRLDDAEQDGDRVYAVIRGTGGASDGKGKGIYAPNPIGQQYAMQRAWHSAGLDPATASLIEAHGTSTKVGDVVEVESLSAIFGCAAPGSIALGSVKSNFGHLKAAAGAAGLLKATLALYHKILPPTLNGEPPNPDIDFRRSPFHLNHNAQEWQLTEANGGARRCGVSAYGFGGTNFHIVLEEHVPGTSAQAHRLYAGLGAQLGSREPAMIAAGHTEDKLPLRGILALGAATPVELERKASEWLQRVQESGAPPRQAPTSEELSAAERLVVDYGSDAELVDRLQKARRILNSADQQAWKALQAQGIFRGSGPAPGKIAFLFPGQGSQYLNMGRELIAVEACVKQVFADGDRVMAPILGRPLSQYIFADLQGPDLIQQAETALMQTEITQPAMLTFDMALYRLLGEYGFTPDMVMGHSLGEYAALIAAGAIPFPEALEAVAARGREMAAFHEGVDDHGWMAAVMAPYDIIQETLAGIDGYVVAANINCYSQSVIGGASQAVEQAIETFQNKGFEARRIPVSHAFHTKIVAPASKPLRKVLDRLHIDPPSLAVVANVTGEFYPSTAAGVKDMLEQQVATPVQWINGLETLYRAGARTFVEVGPKKALKSFVDDVLGNKPDVVSLFTNHPKTGELASFNQAMCGLYASGYGLQADGINSSHVSVDLSTAPLAPGIEQAQAPASQERFKQGSLEEIGQMLVKALRQASLSQAVPTNHPHDRNDPPLGSVVISGTGLGLPGAEKTVMDPENAMRILRGEQLIDLIPERFRQKILEKKINRLVKSKDGNGYFRIIEKPEEVIRLAGRPGAFDLVAEYGVSAKLVEAMDITSQLAMAAGLDALREAGIPLVQTYRQATTGKLLPDRWMLPEALRDETGVIFASAFPGGDRMADEFSRYYTYQSRLEQLQMLEDLRCRTQDPLTLEEILRRVYVLQEALERDPYEFDRRFVFRVLAMGHSQFAEYIGARGPNTHVNAACASTTQAIGLAEDWIRSGRCARVIVIAADYPSGDHLLEWLGTGLLAAGAVATDDCIAEAALPFDRRRHGTIIGMGSCALVLESEDSLRERGMRGIVELLSSEINNSAFHVTRLDPDHIAQVMNNLVTTAERRFGIHRYAIAPHTVFMSHETFTPARGGSASAEVAALRRTFGEAASQIVISNTKGFTGHAFGVGIEDVVAVKILEYGLVPPVPNHRERDPNLGLLNLSRGGRYPVQYALRLAAGFGSQIAMLLLRRLPGGPERVVDRSQYRYWLSQISGYHLPETEVVKRVLRLKPQEKPDRPPAPSSWERGMGPQVRSLAPAFPDGQTYSPVYASELPPPVTQAQPILAAPVQPAAAPVSGTDQSTAQASAGPPLVEAPSPIVEEPASLPSPTLPATSDTVAVRVLAIVSEKTGYPQDMLEADLDLEADLGIDTVKQAETFLALREAFDIPRRDDLKLRDYPTLAHVIGFVKEMRPDLAQGESVESGAQPPALPASPPVELRPLARPADESKVHDQVLKIISEKTGYPVDMLELDLDLEADLGIDTVKQAETFLALREAFDIPRREDLKLRDYPTLAHVVRFVTEAISTTPLSSQVTESGEPQVAANIAPAEADQAASSAAHPGVFPLENADRLPRRTPAPVLRPPHEICKPSGVHWSQNSRVVVMSDQGGVAKALVEHLKEAGVIVLLLPAAAESQELETQIRRWLAEGPVQGLYWLPALDVEPCLEALDAQTWSELNRHRVRDLYTILRCLYTTICEPETFLVTATRLGGLHGYGPQAGASAPLGGAVTGFAKAYKREQSQALVKAIDFETDLAASELAEALIAETLSDPGVVEVGYWQADRYAVSLVESPLALDSPRLALGRESVFLITGAAGGITSAIIADLAAASGGIFYLLDIVPPPPADSADIHLFRTDPEGLKQKLIGDAKSRGERPTPASIDKLLLGIERQEAALRALESIQAAGGQTTYHAVDLRDAQAVSAVVETIRRKHGRIDALIHAAGVEISRALPEKDPQQFDLVFDVKAGGFFNLLKAARGMPIGATVVFSSVAGRFGNRGQADYSAANDLLCKISSSMQEWRPETRPIAIDWTAWADIGMATRGSIPKVMQMAGIEMLPPEIGVPTVRRELCYSPGGEVVIAGKLGQLTEVWDESGGLDLAKAAAWLAARRPRNLMVGEVKAARLYNGLEAETVLDPCIQPFLHDHAMDGTPMLPGVMGIEAFAELASLLAPGYQIAAVENVAFLQAFKFYKMQPQKLYLEAVSHPLAVGQLLAHIVLKSRRELPVKSEAMPQEIVHFTADVRLSRSVLKPLRLESLPDNSDPTKISREELYRIYFHGPAYRVLDDVEVYARQAVGRLAAGLPPDTNPEGAAGLMAPRLIELCLQTAGAWEIKIKSRLALPASIGSVEVFHPSIDTLNNSSKKLIALVQVEEDGQSFQAQVVDEDGTVYVRITNYRTVQLPGHVSLP